MAKVLTNTLGAVNAAALAEGVGLVRRAGIDPGRFLEVASASAGASTVLTLKGEPMFEGRFEPLFKLDHMLKDVRHCLAEAEALGVQLSLGELAAGLYARASEGGHGDEDFAAVVTAADDAEAPER
jgi:3-hydroxyisobutyrate dehydrogenase-like beta-hydroxyacid dehydrogenase